MKRQIQPIAIDPLVKYDREVEQLLADVLTIRAEKEQKKSARRKAR